MPMAWYDGIFSQMKREFETSPLFGGSFHDRFEYQKNNGYLVGQGLDQLGTVLGLTEDDKKELEYMTAQVPVLGDLMGARDKYDYITDYMRNSGLSWSDMEYPTQTRGAGLGLGGAYHFVSDNIRSLYEDDPSEETNKLLRQLVRQQTSQKRYRW